MEEMPPDVAPSIVVARVQGVHTPPQSTPASWPSRTPLAQEEIAPGRNTQVSEEPLRVLDMYPRSHASHSVLV